MVSTINDGNDGRDITSNEISIVDYYDVGVSKYAILQHENNLKSTQLKVDWSLRLIVQEFLVSAEDSSTNNAELIATKLNAAMDQDRLTSKFVSSNSTQYAAVLVMVQKVDPAAIDEVLVRSPMPSSIPTGSPTGLYENMKLEGSEEYGPLAIFQFSWMIAMSICIMFLSPWVIQIYRDKAKLIAKKNRKRRQLAAFANNKNMLGEDHIARREKIRLAFRERYGRDVDVFSDCRVTSNLKMKPSTHVFDHQPLSYVTNSVFKTPRKVKFYSGDNASSLRHETKPRGRNCHHDKSDNEELKIDMFYDTYTSGQEDCNFDSQMIQWKLDVESMGATLHNSKDNNLHRRNESFIPEPQQYPNRHHVHGDFDDDTDRDDDDDGSDVTGDILEYEDDSVAVSL